jgi:hypothetical protein
MNILQNTIRKECLAISAKIIVAFLLTLTIPLASHAASLTTYRIYLDDNNRTESFIVFAKGSTSEQCSLDFSHFDFDENGTLSKNTGKSLPLNSAKPWVRYSPRNFTLTPGKPQSVRFSMRRKPNAEPKEYRSYVAMRCEELAVDTSNSQDGSENPDMPKVSIKPVLVQNVPIIVRTGKLDVEASFTDVKVNGNKISATLARKGTRSLYGRLSLVDVVSGKELSFTNGVSIYPETSSFPVLFELSSEYSDVSKNNLLMRFEEDENYGGELVIEKRL